MSINFSEIYTRAISLIDDPFITKAYNSSPINFYKIMYSYFQDAIPRFNNPMIVASRLSNRTNPDGYVEVFDGNGIDDTFVLSTTPKTDSVYQFKIGDVYVEGTYNAIDNSVTFPYPIISNSCGSFEWYWCGEFNDEFLNICNSNLYLYLIDMIKSILSELLILNWAEKEKNFLLDIRRLLNDTDFKLNDSAASNRSKTNWYDSMREASEKHMNQLALSLMFSKGGVGRV